MCHGSKVFAQWEGSPYDPAIPVLTEAQIDELPSRLALSEAQRATVREILAEHARQSQLLHERLTALREEYRSLAAKVRSQGADDLRSGDGVARQGALVMRRILDQVDEIHGLAEKSRSLIAETLSTEQREAFEQILIERRRVCTLARGVRFSGEGVDVTEVVKQCDLSPAAVSEMSGILEVYVSQLDELLVRRNRMEIGRERAQYEHLIGRGLGEIESETAEGVAALKQLPPHATHEQVLAVVASVNAAAHRRQMESVRAEEPLVAIHRRIRDLNRETIDLLASRLPADDGREIANRFLSDAYPRVYAPLQIDGWVDKVLMLELTNRQREGIANAISGYYDPVCTRLNEELRVLIDREEQSWMDARLNRLDPMIRTRQTEIIEQRRAAQVYLRELVWPMLSEQQQSEVGYPEVSSH